MKITLQRWTGRSWDDVLLSPFKNMGDVQKHLKRYSWHFTKDNPYRILDYKPKKKVSVYAPKYKANAWNDVDRDMIVKI